MRKTIIIILLFIIQISVVNKMYAAGIGTWKAYMAYHEIQQIVAAGNDIFVLASDNLYQYNKNDQSITTYDKVNGLSDTQIKKIAWSKTSKRLIIVYQNSNIDLVETNGEVINISDLYTKSMTEDKTVNGITIYGKYAYLGTGFGVVKVNMSNAEISESYILGENIEKVIIQDNTIFARLNKWYVLKASVNDNLLDKKNWEKINYENEALFSEDLTDYNTYLPVVSQLKVDGPKYNHFYEMTFKNNTLYTTGGMWSASATMAYPGSIQVLKDDNWIIYEDNIDTITGYKYQDINCLDIDPNDPEHVFAGGRTGLYEFKSGKLVKFYNMDNSPLRPALDRGKELNNNYLMIHGIKFDKNGNLWILNSQAKNANLFVIEKGTQTIKSKYTNKLDGTDNCSLFFLRSMFEDSHNLFWFVNEDWRDASLFCMKPETGEIVKYNKYVNQDNTAYPNISAVKCIMEDKEGNIWVGTNVGAFYISSNDIGKDNVTFYQVKVPRNDGTNLADYLLSGVDIRCMAIDGANRKWFGTGGNGIYVISDDNLNQIYHFTVENSQLLSNNINSIAINNKTGETFIATDIGLCSFMNDATESSETMDKDNVYAYPNPVRPEYNGNITVVGLTFNADVKITTASGYLVFEGRSNGGTFTWDGCDKDGNRVASGIYNVITATSTGKKGTVCKIAIIR